MCTPVHGICMLNVPFSNEVDCSKLYSDSTVYYTQPTFTNKESIIPFKYKASQVYTDRFTWLLALNMAAGRANLRL